MFSMKWRLVVARTLVVVLAGNPLLMAAHGIERSHRPPADFELTERREQLRLQLQAAAAARAAAQAASNTAQLAAGQQAAQKHSANGTDVIDIAAPGQSGVSHNQFMQFNVTADGLILNNSQGPALSALGGWTDGNRRLAAGTARLILAEVTGSGRSSLLGYTEVLGDSAEFVLANPNGISCNGCGFINTPRVVLATGIPDLLNGNLLGINISGGDVVIDGAGLNASNVNKFDILTRAMTLNAALYANELNIRTGSNYYDYQSLQAQANANQPDSIPAYQFALDASALGAMYANSISLIGTEAGLGVRSKGLISSVDSLQLTADGRLELKDTIAGGELALRSQRSDIITNGSTYGQTVNIAAAGTLQNSGLIAAADTMQLSAAQLQQSGDVIAGINQQGQWQDSAAQQLNISGTAVNQGRIISRGTQQLTAKELQNSAGALLQGDSSTLTTTVFNNSGTLNSSALTLDSATVSNAGHIQAQQLSINAEQFSQTAGAVYQTGADGRLSLSGHTLQLDGGVLVTEGMAQLNASDSIHNNADWLMAGNTVVTTADMRNSATVQLQAQAELTADTLTNSGNMLFTAEQATALNIKNTLDNQGGLLQFGNAAVVTAAEINNDRGQISHTGSGTMSLQATQQLNNAAGQILSNGTMQVSAAELNNQQGILSAEQLTLIVGGDVNNQAGTIRGTTLSLGAQQLNNSSGIIAAAGPLQINAVALHNNAGEIYSAGRLNISGGNISNAGGALISQSALQLNVAELDNSGGTVQSAGAMLLHTTALDNRQGRIAAEADMQLAGTVINNNAGTILGNTQLDISAQQLNNDNGNLIADTVDLQLSGLLSNNNGLLQATNTLTANAAQIDNSGGSIQATSALLSSQQSLNNSGGTINAQALALSAAALDNSYGVILASDSGDNALQLTGISQLTNDNGAIANHGNNWQLALDNLSNDNGKLLHLGSGSFTLSQAGTLSNSGTIAANANLVLNATDVVNSGTLQAQQNLQLNAGLSNQAGAVLVANDITVNGPDRAISNAGSVSANNSLQLAGASLHNSHLLYGGNSAVITAADVENSGTLSAANLDVAGFSLLQNSGRIESNAAAYSGDILDNQSGAVLINAGNSANGLQLNVAQLTNSGTVHNSSQDMSLGGNLSNSGSVIHAGLGTLLLGNSGSINNAGGSIASAGTANIQNSIAGAGTVYAEQGMQLSSSGTFVNNSQLYSKGDILVTSALHNQGGSLLSDANLTIDTSGNVTNSGTLQGQNLSLTSAVLNNNAGTITSTGTDNAQISATSLSNNSGVIQATNNNFSIITRSGELDNSNGQINHSGSGSLTLNSASHLNQQAGTVQSAGQLLVNAQGNLNNSYGVLSAGQYQLTASGSLNNNDGRIVSSNTSGSGSISSAALTNRSGHIAANGTNLTLNAAALDNNNGSILLAGLGNLAITAGSIANDAAGARIISNGAISLSGGTLLRNAGQISAANLLSVNAATLTNSGTLASRSGKVDIDSSGTLTNSGTVSGANGIDIDVRTLNNSAGLLQSDGLLDIAVNSLSVGRMQARDIALDSKSSIALQNGEHISAGRNINLHSDANISNSGTIVASGTLDISGKELTNNSVGVIRAGGNAVLDLNKLTNDGIVSSSSVLTLDVKDTINNGTLAAGSHLDINGNIDNRNLVFAGSLLTIDGNVDNTANIYSNQDAIISGTTVTNKGGSIAAAQDLSIGGTILNTYSGQLAFNEAKTTTQEVYSGTDPQQWGWTAASGDVLIAHRERRTITTYEAVLSGKAGVIASGGNMWLSGNITNNFGTISAGGNLDLSGQSFDPRSASNQVITEATVYREEWAGGCLQEMWDEYGPIGCAEPGAPVLLSSSDGVKKDPITTYTGGSLGTVYAGSITGSLKGEVTLTNASPLDGDLGSPVDTGANGSSGSASRGNSATANNSSTVVVNRSSGNAKSTGTAERAASGVVAGSTGSVNADWHDNNAKHNTELTAGSSVIGRQQVSAVHSGISIQSAGFATLNVGNSLSAASANAPAIPQQQAGGAVGNGNIAGIGGYNPDLIIKGLVDNQQGTLTAQKGSAQQSGNYSNSSQPAGQNVFITDEQMRVLTEDLGFDANAINQGQQGLYAAISQNDLLADGVTLSAGGTIDITADGGFNINSGIAAGEGLILRSENGLEMGSLGFFDSDKLLGLQLGGDFTNTMNLQSDTLWLDIGGNFTNQGSLTGSDVLSISAGKDLINQNLLSGGKVILDAGGDIINRVEFSQHTVQNGNNSTTYTTVGKAPQIISNDSLSMTAGNNIDLQGSKFASAGDISLNAGNDVLLAAVEKLSGHEKYFKGGHDIELHRTYDVVSFDAGGNLSVVAGNNLQSEGAVFAAVGDVELAAGNDMNLLGVVEYHEDRDKRTKKSTFKKTVYVDETYSADHQGSAIIAGGNVSLNAQQNADGLQVFNSGNVLLEGTYVNAGGNMVAYSEGELNIVSGEEWQSESHTKKKSMFGGLFGSTKVTETDVQYLGHADLNAGGDMVLLAQKDINVLAGKIDADNIIAQAGFGNEDAKAADINILGDTETSSMYQETRRNGLALDFSDNFLSVAKETANENRITQTDYVGSVFTARDNMALAASRDVNVVGSVLDAGGELLLDAGRDINVLTGQGSGSSYSRHTETKTGIAVSADSNTASVFAGDDIQKDALTSNSTTQTGSLLKADNVRLNAGNNLLISGSDINATTDIRLSAVKDINIVTAQELFNQQTEQSSTRDGLTVSANYNIGNTVDAISNLGQGGDATSIASSVMQAADTLNNAGPSAGAHLGQTTTTTTNTVQQGVAKGSSLTSGGDVIVSAGGNALFEGVKVNSKGNIDVDAENISVIAAQNSSGSKHNTEYLQVGLNLSASGSNVSLTAGFSKSDSELDTQNTESMGSSLSAGGNVSLNARNDLAIIGSDVNGDDNVELIAGNDIVIKAAESQFSSNSEDSHLSAGAGANFGSNGVGFTANMAMGEGELDREGTTYSNSHITAGKSLTVKSGNDTSIAGGNLAATDVDMDIGGDLTVASVQNTGQVKGDRWDVSANITVGAGASGGASVGYGETEGSSAWVNEQSSIIGSGSVNIRTEGHTQIDGAVIANIDENGKDGGNLSLDTGSLAYSDIADHDKEKSFYLNVGFTMGDDTSTNQKESDTNYSASGNYSNHDREQINRATVGEGSIVVRDNPEQDISDLNRDTGIAQEITKDKSKDMNLYVSTTALDSLGNLAESPEKRDEQLNKWRNNVASIGSPDAYMGLLNASLDALEQTPGAINDAIEAVSYFVENIGSLSPKELIAFDEALKNNPELLQRLQNSDSAAERELAEKMLAGIAEAAGTLAQQEQLPEDNHQIAEAPPMPEKSFAEQQNEFTDFGGLLNDYYDEGQKYADENLVNAIKRGEYAALQNETIPAFGSDIDFDGAIDFYQNQSSQLRESLGLPSDAPDGWIGDALLWGGASLLDATYQTVQFGMNIYNYPTSGVSPFAAKYDSLIGYDAPFGSPGSLAGVAGLKVGEMGSYIWEPAALFGGVAKLNGLRKVSEAGDIPPVGVVDKFDDIPPPSKYDINVSGGDPVLLDDLYGQTFESIPLSHLPNWKTGSLKNDGELGEQMVLQLLNENAGLNLKPLQNGSNWGCDGCAVDIKGDTITVVVVDAKSSVNGVGGAKNAVGDPRTRLEGWLGNSSIANSDPALADALREALDSGNVKVQGVTVKVGVPAPGTTGEATFKVEPWPNK